MQAFFICQRNRQQKTQQKLGFLFIKCNYWLLGSVDLSRLNLQQSVWYLGKAEPMLCGYSP